MGTRAKPKALGGSGAIIGALWVGYSTLNTARDIPTDAGWVAKMLVDPPVYLPWLAAAIGVAVLIWAFCWPSAPDEENGGVVQSPVTHGPDSPAFAVWGDYHHHEAPTLTPKSSNGFSESSLRIQGQGDLRSRQEKNASKPSPDLLVPVYKIDISAIALPDFTLNDLLVRLFNSCNFVDDRSLEALEKIRDFGRDISDQMSLRSLSAWGRINGSTLELLPTNISKKGFGIGRNSTGDVDHMLQYSDENGCTVNVTDFRFLKAEINEVWPDE